MEQPTLETERLVLRPFTPADADPVRELAGDIEVSRYTLHIPHPYTLEDARTWIESHAAALEREEQVTYAVTREGKLVGAIGLVLALEHARAELGYWIGRPYWGRGYATEAAAAVVDWAFDDLGLRRVHAGHFSNNPPSGRVLQKLGMRHEGTARQHFRKWDTFLDVERYGLLRDER